MRRAAVILLLIAATGGCSKKKPLSANLKQENKVALRSVNLYFESPELLLVPERRDIELPENPAGAIPVVVRELFKGSANSAVPRLFPEDIVLRGAYLLPDGTVFVDVGGPTITAGWNTGTHQELMAIESLVQTLVANFSQARRVRILVNGSPAETLGGHVSLSRPLGPMASVVAR